MKVITKIEKKDVYVGDVLWYLSLVVQAGVSTHTLDTKRFGGSRKCNTGGGKREQEYFLKMALSST